MAAVWGPAYMVVPILGSLSGILASAIACKCNSGCRVSHAVGVAPGSVWSVGHGSTGASLQDS